MTKTKTKIPDISRCKAYLSIRKQRMLCKHCNSTFVLTSSIVRKRCQISNNTKYAIALDAKNKISEKDIATHHNVSHNTVSRVINSFYNNFKVNFNFLPKHLCFDEFKSVKRAVGAMSFIFCDSDSKKIIDILEDRRLPSLTKYFNKFSKAAREGVETIVIDMFSPYIQLIKQLFPKAKIIIDKFHIVQLFSRSLNKTRITLMNENKTMYSKLKKYWKLLLKNKDKLEYNKSFYSYIYKKRIREVDIVYDILSNLPALKDNYELYQNIISSIKNNNFEILKLCIDTKKDTLSKFMLTSLKTIKKYIPHIKNSLKYKYNNGLIEGINNKIKVIKRIAFGYRSFFVSVK